MSFDLDAYLAGRRALVDAALDRHLVEIARRTPEKLASAMRYSLLAGGKRLRPVLVLATCEAVGGEGSVAMNAACAVEMIHTYSLVHDDLPAMDDDDFRRGRPTSHKVYGEAIAILAGDALLTEAFRVLALHGAGAGDGAQRGGPAASVLVELVGEIARAAGADGMVGGQVIDIEATGKRVTLDELEALHRAKTGALLLGSVRAGALLGGCTSDQLERLSVYGSALGLAFQIIDDVLDVTADLATLGKDPGSDREAGKTTFVDLLGVDGARERARQVMATGIAALAPLGASARPLEALASYTVNRDR